MRPRFVGRVGPADAVTVVNAMIGFLAVAAATVDPAVVVAAYAADAWDLSVDAAALSSPSPELLAAASLPALFVGMVVLRLGLYTAYDAGNHHTEGVPSTLAATVLTAVVLASAGNAPVLLAGTGVLSYLMVTTITYPDLLARDALIMGGVQGIAVLFPNALGRAFPYALLVLSLAYLLLSPRFYWWPDAPAG